MSYNIEKNEIWITKFQFHLIEWFKIEFRNLPWRNTDDPYKIWISEIMLQQTQVKTVIPYYKNFIDQFPTVHALAEAPLTKVLKIWQGMGYYARARNLLKASELIVSKHNGEFPPVFDDALALPGIGPYSAAAILSIAYDQKLAVVDGNVKRVLSRVFCVSTNPGSNSGKEIFQSIAEKLIPDKNTGLYNQAIMELGALICKPRTPRCPECPIQSFCTAFQNNKQSEFPLKQVKKIKPHYTFAIAIIKNKDKILIDRRDEKGLLGGLWEFPGGEVKTGQNIQDALTLEVQNILDIDIQIGERLTSITHAYTHFSMSMHAYECQYKKGPPRALECKEWKWEKFENLQQYAFSRAYTKIIENLDKY